MGSKGSVSAAGVMAESQVSGIIKSLGVLEDDLDSLNAKAGEMKKQLAIKAQSQIESMTEKTRQMATKEAEIIINKSKEKAEAESKRISDEGEAKLSEIKSSVDSNFEGAVDSVVSIILKP